MYKMRTEKLLVTGGAGFMGSDFIRYLLQKTDFEGEIVNLDLLTYAGDLGNLKEVETSNRYKFIQGDICDMALLEKIFKEHHFDIIVHFAAESHVDRSIDQPKTFIETNIVGTYTLLEMVRRHPKLHFHLISTDEVYGDLPHVGYFTEDSPYAPSSPYAASKAAADHLTLSYARTFGIKTTLSHASNNFGPRQHFEKLIPRMIQRCITGEPLTIYGTGENIRDWLYVEDHSRAIHEILKKGRVGEVYNVGGQTERTNLEVVDHIIHRIAEITKKPPEEMKKKIVHVADRPGHDFRYAMDISKMKREIGWEPKITFDEGLDRTIGYILNA